jgi:hypothetical protein
MWTRFVEADQGITPTIAHVPTGIVHGQATAEAGFEKVPKPNPEDFRKFWPVILLP